MQLSRFAPLNLPVETPAPWRIQAGTIVLGTAKDGHERVLTTFASSADAALCVKAVNMKHVFMADFDKAARGHKLPVINSHGVYQPDYWHGAHAAVSRERQDDRERTDALVKAAAAIADRDVRYELNEIVIECADHGEALRLMRDLRDAIRNTADRP